MERQLGVRNFGLDIDSGVATFLPKAGEPLDLAAVKDAVYQAGFELLWLELDVRGSLGRRTDPNGEERPAVRVADTGQTFLLVAGDSGQDRDAFGLVLEWLDDASSAVVVRGGAHSHPGGPPVITVQDFRVVGDG